MSPRMIAGEVILLESGWPMYRGLCRLPLCLAIITKRLLRSRLSRAACLNRKAAAPASGP